MPTTTTEPNLYQLALEAACPLEVTGPYEGVWTITGPRDDLAEVVAEHVPDPSIVPPENPPAPDPHTLAQAAREAVASLSPTGPTRRAVEALAAAIDPKEAP